MSAPEPGSPPVDVGGDGTPTASDRYGLPARPPVEPDILALVAAAVDQVWPRPVVAAPPTDRSHLTWRFSARFWAKPSALRRERPWARG